MYISLVFSCRVTYMNVHLMIINLTPCYLHKRFLSGSQVMEHDNYIVIMNASQCQTIKQIKQADTIQDTVLEFHFDFLS